MLDCQACGRPATARSGLTVPAACFALLPGLLLPAAVIAEQIAIDLEQGQAPQVRARVEPGGYVIEVSLAGRLRGGQALAVSIRTRQQGRWSQAVLEAGKYLASQFDRSEPTKFRLESGLKPGWEAAERRFQKERDQLRAQARQAGKDQKARKAAHNRLLRERIAALRAENVRAGASSDGRATLQVPALPPAAMPAHRIAVLEQILHSQCLWPALAALYRQTGFAPPADTGGSDFNAAMAMANEIKLAVKGANFRAQYLTATQIRTLLDGFSYRFKAVFCPSLPGGPRDQLWRTAPAVRLADGLICRARLEGSLSRQAGKVVQWWRVESASPSRVQAQMVRGGGDCFWRWVEGPGRSVRFIRVLLHSPAARYQLQLKLAGAKGGEEIAVFDGPSGTPAKGPF